MARRRDNRLVRRCDHCGKGGLKWIKVGSVWRLEDTRGDVHRCAFGGAVGPLGPRVTDRDRNARLTATMEYEQYENSY